MKDLNIGEVVELPVGMMVYHNQGHELVKVETATRVVVEATRKVLPFELTGVEAHFEECFIVKARALHLDGSYHFEGALLTFATRGDFRPEFILPAGSNQVLKVMKRHFVDV